MMCVVWRLFRNYNLHCSWLFRINRIIFRNVININIASWHDGDLLNISVLSFWKQFWLFTISCPDRLTRVWPDWIIWGCRKERERENAKLLSLVIFPQKIEIICSTIANLISLIRTKIINLFQSPLLCLQLIYRLCSIGRQRDGKRFCIFLYFYLVIKIKFSG